MKPDWLCHFPLQPYHRQELVFSDCSLSKSDAEAGVRVPFPFAAHSSAGAHPHICSGLEEFFKDEAKDQDEDKD